MYAFALWDGRSQTLHLARDPFGIKPMHYLSTPDGLYLASEKKALLPFAASASAGDAGVDAARLRRSAARV